MQQDNSSGAVNLPARQVRPAIQRYLEQGAYPHVTREEYLRLRASSDDVQLRLVLEILWVTGSRISEVLALHAADLLRREQEYQLNVLRSKRRKPIRELLPLPLELGLKLEDYIRLRGIADDDPLFPISRWTVWRFLRDSGERILGRRVTPHMFRHGRIYDLVGQGVHPFEISRIVGHVNLQTTLGYYHPRDEDIRETLSR